jgi:hypothetical protein
MGNHILLFFWKETYEYRNLHSYMMQINFNNGCS